MSRSKLPPLGTVFLVPLRDQGYAVGVLARASGKGTAFGYFFGQRISDTADVSIEALDPERAVLVGKFGDIRLLRNEWPIVGPIDNWTSESWPVVPMARVDELDGRAWLSTYDDALRLVAEIEIAYPMAAHYPPDGMMGAGAVEIRLTKLVARGAVSEALQS